MWGQQRCTGMRSLSAGWGEPGWGPRRDLASVQGEDGAVTPNTERSHRLRRCWSPCCSVSSWLSGLLSVNDEQLWICIFLACLWLLVLHLPVAPDCSARWRGTTGPPVMLSQGQVQPRSTPKTLKPLSREIMVPSRWLQTLMVLGETGHSFSVDFVNIMSSHVKK